ncbi:SusC/RagA family TonB-linked outer membrane protein [Polaribacter sp. Hel1_85]|uniref:SusC/RagA family TonB-linked outer membrane protein n=1 Tax=Polaribacter sp. Hel1_85 TaxID=1250005 RepID=UPI00052C6F85|nr:SusC/RagA family TonB-linked outer membrane protein [Polaribacter sp. Hel1_85]KGL58902.1 TonB-dependent receptor, plug [Polaribacter sp. Hel1_85]
MKLTITKLKFFVFCLLNYLAINISFAQKTTLDNLVTSDTIKVVNEDEILKTPFGVFNLSQTTGSVFRISGKELRKTSGDNLSEALRGRVPGLRVVRTSNVPGTIDIENLYSYSLNGGTPYVLVDGQPRGLQVDLREVEEVIVLSDPTFNSLLGNFGDNGLIYVITTGNKIGKPVVEVNLQQSINIVTRLPELLSAAEYARVLNRASNNDGFGDVYSQEAIDAYENGSDPINYPNIDRQDVYLSNLSLSNYASLNAYGGTEKVEYSAFVGYSDWEGLEKVGAKIEGKNLTFRTKINTRVTELIRAHASVYGKFGTNDRPVLGANAMMWDINRIPANEFPLKVGDSAYIVSNNYGENTLSELELGGQRSDYNSNMVFDMGLDFDFKNYVPGLKYDTYVLLKTYNQHTLQNNNTPGLYTLENLQDVDGLDSLAVKLFRQENLVINASRISTGVQRTFTYGGNFSYFKKFNESTLNLNLSHLLYYNLESANTRPDSRNLTFNLNGSYALKNKYILYANMNMSSSSKFLDENRTRLFPTVGVAWIASNEDFLNDNSFFDRLKFRASYGKIGTEYPTTNNSFLYLDTYGTGTKTYLGSEITTQNTNSYQTTQTGNKDIDWIIFDQFFAGTEVQFLKKFKLDVNYFNVKISNLVTQASALYASSLGRNAYLPNINFIEYRNTGFNSNITFNDSKGSFRYYASFNAGYNKRIKEKLAEVQYPDEYRLQEGQATDNIVGYLSDGLFTTDNIDDALPQFGEVQVGDIKYVDLNGDNVIDTRDQTTIGNSIPRFNYGINLGVEYKGINLDVVGMGVANYDFNLNGREYFQPVGLRTYYGSVNKDLPNGNSNPRLSTIPSLNNFTNSDYWLVDGSYFRISNAELGFTLPESVLGNGAFTNVKLFLRGSNLALFSKIKDLDPEDINAGYSEYPMMRSFVFGATMNF